MDPEEAARGRRAGSSRSRARLSSSASRAPAKSPRHWASTPSECRTAAATSRVAELLGQRAALGVERARRGRSGRPCTRRRRPRRARGRRRGGRPAPGRSRPARRPARLSPPVRPRRISSPHAARSASRAQRGGRRAPPRAPPRSQRLPSWKWLPAIHIGHMWTASAQRLLAARGAAPTPSAARRLSCSASSRSSATPARPPRLGIGGAGELEVEGVVARLQRRRLARLGEALARVLAHRLEQAVAVAAARPPRPPPATCRRAAPAGRRPRAASTPSPAATASAASSAKLPAKTARRRNSARSAVGQQVVAPAQRGPERLLAVERRPAAGGQHGEAVAEPLGDLRGRERPHARRGELERERHPVQPEADLGHRARRSPRSARSRARRRPRARRTAAPTRSAASSAGVTARPASGSASDGTRHVTSPGTRSGSRLVARMRSPGQAREQVLGQRRRRRRPGARSCRGSSSARQPAELGAERRRGPGAGTGA